MAYMPILMSGKNHAYGHYHKYDRIAEGRGFPHPGRGPRLRRLSRRHLDDVPGFGLVHAASERALRGRPWPSATSARRITSPASRSSRWARRSRPCSRTRDWSEFAEDFRGIVRYGGYNHMIGLATHDVTGTFAGPDEVLVPGFRLRLRHPALPPRRGDRHPDRRHDRHHRDGMREPLARRAPDGRGDRSH